MLDCRDEGQGPAVLLIHGCPGDLKTFDVLFDGLRATHRLIAPALPGYHASPALRPYDFEQVKHDVQSLLRERGVERLAAIVGFSLGTYHALNLALAEGGAPPVVCALGGFAGLQPEEQQGLRQFAPFLRGRRSDDPELRQILAQRNLSAAHRERRPEDVRRVDAWLEATTPDVFADELEAISFAPDLHPRLGSADFQLFIRVGSEDVATPPAQARRMAAASSRASLEEVPGLGHAQLVEDPEGVLAWVRGALREFGKD